MELLTAQQVARFLGITYNQLWRLIAQGKPHPPYTLVGDRKRFIRSEVEKWLLENQVVGGRDA
jgi:excisionase family DNA binding protein